MKLSTAFDQSTDIYRFVSLLQCSTVYYLQRSYTERWICTSWLWLWRCCRKKERASCVAVVDFHFCFYNIICSLKDTRMLMCLCISHFWQSYTTSLHNRFGFTMTSIHTKKKNEKKKWDETEKEKQQGIKWNLGCRKKNELPNTCLFLFFFCNPRRTRHTDTDTVTTRA